MIELQPALDGMNDAKDKLRNATAVVSPTILSEQMYRLSQFTGVIDEHLADYEKEYSVKLAANILNKIRLGMKVSPAETQTKMEMIDIKSQIDYLDRISKSAWKQLGIVQSRINHLVLESKTNI